ncbi:MAG TPA: WecB/TagA/CpsF family glycosyltransferase [Candidatus Eremiobacteraceae bacterium]|nr:WecB/TagA/CpsF family glycosyltransferase [Candidatus Eremiobacteraceae bacterium]
MSSNVLTPSQTATVCSFRVLGVRVNAIQIPEVIALMEEWIAQRDRSHYVAVTGMHGVTESKEDACFKVILEKADLVVPDGMPLVWLGRWHGYRLKRRVYGPELMETFCAKTGAKYRHFFYGGAPGVADGLARTEQERHGIRIAGTYCPPFRALTEKEQADVVATIQTAKPDVLWVGLSTPKQERWMDEYKDRLDVPVLLGVGAAFDLNTGRLKQAPRWMRENGLEWLFRLLAEPRRLWKRYLVQGSKFAWCVGLELLGLRKFC